MPSLLLSSFFLSACLISFRCSYSVGRTVGRTEGKKEEGIKLACLLLSPQPSPFRLPCDLATVPFLEAYISPSLDTEEEEEELPPSFFRGSLSLLFCHNLQHRSQIETDPARPGLSFFLSFFRTLFQPAGSWSWCEKAAAAGGVGVVLVVAGLPCSVGCLSPPPRACVNNQALSSLVQFPFSLPWGLTHPLLLGISMHGICNAALISSREFRSLMHSP